MRKRFLQLNRSAAAGPRRRFLRRETEAFPIVLRAYNFGGPSRKNTIIDCSGLASNRDQVALENTHPFGRELWGRNWSFAHNGQLKGTKKLALTYYRPVGSTDSEHALCWIMDRLRERWQDPPPERTLRGYIEELSRRLAGHGVFNILLSHVPVMVAVSQRRFADRQ